VIGPEIVALLGVGLLLALVAVVVLAIGTPRRIARDVARVLAAEHVKEENRALAVRASAAELEAIVGTARLLLNDQAAATDEIRALGVWGAAFANVVYARAGATNTAGSETVQKPAPPPVSRERPAAAQPSAPEIAAGLHRSASAPPHRPPVRLVAKTLPSMQAVPAPTSRPVDPVVVAVEHRGCDGGEGASP
jgi:hypothetical protein